ncbi:hypothetical protein DPMN_061953 [Dreissena polymorpha]|uniref:Uncharacterized protein n=1 Tax=Dreissena polymorpha TaxID=45954 RepID=A0A9D4C8J1_DREPO|nr:hypothetical protein DPMN_061953 [Dreissena polymorpha]
MYGISKSAALKMLSKSERFKIQCLAFNEATNIETIQGNREQLIAMLHGTENPIVHDELRFKTFSVKVASSTSHVAVKSLPPIVVDAVFKFRKTYRTGQNKYITS